MRTERTNRGNATTGAIAAALIVAAALLGSSWMLTQSLDGVRKEVEGLKGTFIALLAPRPQEAAPQPEPEIASDERYEVSVAGAPARGPESAKVTIVTVSDFECPFCARVEPTLQKILAEYPNDVRIVYKHMPLPFHKEAPAAHAAAEAAARQGKFWEMYEKLFANQRELGPEKYEAWAQEIGLDVARFKQDVASADVKKRIDADMQEVEKLGVNGTPAFFINGRQMSGAQPFENFKKIIDEELGRKAG